jgi:type II secretory pathway pseudopilin PulG
MLKKIIAIVLILVSAGTWGYLDYLNKQELQAAEELRQSMIQARAQAQARAKAAAEAKAKFEAMILADLTTCKATAEKAKEDFLEANKKPVRRKPGQFTVPAAAQEEANKTLETSNAACQTNYDTRLKNGS